MGLNNDGYSGVDIEQIALEKVIIVGTQAPNVSPSVKIDANGKSLPKIQVTKNGGTQILETSGWDCSTVDTSWLSHGGNFCVAAGNKINMTAGAGGFTWQTAGPTTINTAFQEFIATHCFDVNTRLFSVAATQRMQFMTSRLDFDLDEFYVEGNTYFVNNVLIHGGLFVNGELFCSHITSQAQTNFTDPCEGIKGFINPGQSFTVFNGTSVASKQLIQPTLGWMQLDKLPDKPGMVDCYIAIELPDPIGLIEVPCRIGFPNGISLMSDGMFNIMPQAETIVAGGTNRPEGCGLNMADLSGPGHIHSYVGPAVNFASDTGSVYNEAKDMMSSTEPKKPKACMPNGMATLDQLPSMLQKAATNSIKEWLKNLWQDINPFRTKTSM